MGYYYDKPYKSPFYYVFRELVIWAFTSGIYVAGLCFCVYYMHTMQISGELYTLTNWTDYPSIFLVVSPVISALACVRIGQGLILLPQIHKVAFFETTLKHEVLGDVDTYVEGSYYTRREKIGEIGEYSDKIDVYGDVTYKRDDYILNTYSTCDTCQRVCENCKHEGKVFKRKKTSTRRKPVE